MEMVGTAEFKGGDDDKTNARFQPEECAWLALAWVNAS
jgi:hypothetical protein